MYVVRETRTSILRSARGPVPHALEHILGPRPRTSLCPSVGKASSSRQTRSGYCSQSDPATGRLVVARSCSTVPSSTELLQVCKLNPAADRDLTIGELPSKLVQSELLPTEQALKLSEIRASQRAKEAGELIDKQAAANAENLDHLQTVAQLQEQLQCHELLLAKQGERIQELQQELNRAEETIFKLHEKLNEATVQIEQLSKAEDMPLQDKARKQEELKHNGKDIIGEVGDQDEAAQCGIKKIQLKVVEAEEQSQAEEQLRQQVARLEEQLQSNQDLLEFQAEKLKDTEQTEQDLREELANKELLFSQVTQELIERDKDLTVVCRTLKEKHRMGWSQEHRFLLLQEQVKRLYAMRADLKQRNVALEKEIIRLKHDIRKYAEIIVGNDGEPFYQVQSVGNPSGCSSYRRERRETKAINSRNIAKESAQTRLPCGQESNPVRSPIRQNRSKE
ncbi:tropomyosin alpha-1 chain-like isoform X2 [Drosophila kikkawai]|uniref:Tropomyosin alpha-1 chain-like isoform X2 n=1 Tax=Drosophila kikkawai TaxID=30033 RepID=A0ABM4GJB5_DROKI